MQELTFVGMTIIISILFEIIITFRRSFPPLINPTVPSIGAKDLIVIIFSFGIGLDVVDLLLGLENMRIRRGLRHNGQSILLTRRDGEPEALG